MDAELKASILATNSEIGAAAKVCKEAAAELKQTQKEHGAGSPETAEASKKFTERFKWYTTLLEKLSKLLTRVSAAFITMFTCMFEGIRDFAKIVFGWMSNLLQCLASAAAAVVEASLKVINKIFSGLWKILQGAWDFGVEAFAKAAGFFKSVTEGYFREVQPRANMLTAFLTGAVAVALGPELLLGSLVFTAGAYVFKRYQNVPENAA